MDRRSFLATGSLALLPVLGGSAAIAQPAPAGSGDVRLNALFEQIFQQIVARSPTFATSLGLDKGPLAALKGKLDVRPAAIARREDLAFDRADIAAIEAIPPATLSDAAKLNREVVLYSFRSQILAPAQFDIDSVQRPYPIFQQGGAYFSMPDFLNTAHTIETAADAEAYLSRLEAIRDACSTMRPHEQRARPRAASSPPAGRST